MVITRMLLLLLMLAMQVRMVCGRTAVTVVFVSAAVRHVWVAPLRTVKTVVPLTMHVDETGTVLGAERY